MIPRSAFFSALLLALAAALVEAGTPGYALGAQIINAPSCPGFIQKIVVDEQGTSYCFSVWNNRLHVSSGTASIRVWNEALAYSSPASSARDNTLYFSPNSPLDPYSEYGASCIIQMGSLSNITNASISLLAGSCSFSTITSDGPGSAARFRSIVALSAAADDNLYVVDMQYIRRVSSTGITSTMTATGNMAFETF
jgi:hypothetical protein